MSAIPVYIGVWHDYARSSGVLGQVVTLKVKWGGYLIAALSTFVGLVGTSSWTIVAFGIHQWRAKPGKADLLFMQQQAVYRNQGSSSSAALDMLKLCWSWRKRKGQLTRVNHLKARTFWRALPPVIIFIGFTAAGLFIAQVAGATYQSNDVKVALNRCGFWQYNIGTSEGSAAAQLKLSNDTLAGRAYSKNCYDTDVALPGCGIYPVQSLPIHQSTVPCPFGNDPTGHTLCRFGNNEALQLDTGLLDSTEMLGINAQKQNRLLARKVVTCSPIYIKNYYNITQDPNGNYIDQYYLGPIPLAGTDYTWTYHETAAGDRISYQVQAVYASKGTWHPVPALQVTTGDVSLFFLAQNSIQYINPVDDILFAAHQATPTDISGIQNLYGADQYVNAMACVDQYQICDPNSNPYDCTILGNLTQLRQGLADLGLSVQQQAVAERITTPLPLITTYTIVNSLSTAALLARDRFQGLVCTGLPSNQWQIEVHGWMSTSLAKYQSSILEFAANIADLGPYGTVEIPGNVIEPVTQALQSTCSQQRIRNTGAYQTFSLVGLLITICVGTAIILLSLFLELCVQSARHRRPNPKTDYREIARIADHTLQYQRQALLGAGYRDGWDRETLLDNFPVTIASPRTLFPLASRESPMDEDYAYVVPEQLVPMNQITHAHAGAGAGADDNADADNATHSQPHQGRTTMQNGQTSTTTTTSTTGAGRGGMTRTPLPQEHLPGATSSNPRSPRSGTYGASASQQHLNAQSAESSRGSGRDATSESGVSTG